MARGRLSLALRAGGRLVGFGATGLGGLGVLRGESGLAVGLGLQLIRSRRQLLRLCGMGVGLLAVSAASVVSLSRSACFSAARRRRKSTASKTIAATAAMTMTMTST